MTVATGKDSSADWLKSEGEGSQIATGKLKKGNLSEEGVIGETQGDDVTLSLY